MEVVKPIHVRVALALGWRPFPYTLAAVEWWNQPCVPPGVDPHISTAAHLPRYDTDWSATGPLIERLRIHGEMRLDPTCHCPRWCAFLVPDKGNIIEAGPHETLPIAVCHLILALKGAGKLETP